MKVKWISQVLVVLILLLFMGQASALAATHTVSSGDTIFSIARAHGTTAGAIIQVNNISNPDRIYPGQVLNIPAVSRGVRLESRSGGLSSADINLFARLVYSEASGESHTGQVAVAASVLNRVASPRYPNTLRGVIFQVVGGSYQYSPVLDGRINLPANEAAYRAVRDALNGWDPSLGATGFYNPRKTRNAWVRRQPVTTVIGNHIFFLCR